MISFPSVQNTREKQSEDGCCNIGSPIIIIIAEMEYHLRVVHLTSKNKNWGERNRFDGITPNVITSNFTTSKGITPNGITSNGITALE